MTAGFLGFLEDDDYETMPDSSNAIRDSAAESLFTPPQPDDGGSLFDGPTLEPDASLLNEPKRSKRAEQYEAKVKGWLRLAIKATVEKPATAPDAAALLLYGPDIAESFGDLADDSATVRRIVDMLDSGVTNPALALLSAALPLALQVMRNHEPTAEVTRVFRNPITKKERPIRVNVRMFQQTHMFTHRPDDLTQAVFTQPSVVEMLAKQGLHVGR